MRFALWLVWVCAAAAGALAGNTEVKKIWDAAPHNAFTDLIHHRGEWLCVFREGEKHVSPDGAVRVIASRDGKAWTSAARLTMANADLRDPKITVTPKGELMLTAAAALVQPAAHRHQTYAWFSRDTGRTWGEPVAIGEPDHWLWRITWHKGTAYGIAYGTTGQGDVRLYRSADGRRFDVLVAKLFDRGFPNESGLLFQPDGTAVCLLRREKDEKTAMLGTAKAPYTEWTWRDLGVRIGGPQIVQRPDGTLLAGVRLHDGQTRTALCRLDVAAGTLTELEPLPSSGDSSYPGMVWHDGQLWMSYYSSHEGKTSIYLARTSEPANTGKGKREKEKRD